MFCRSFFVLLSLFWSLHKPEKNPTIARKKSLHKRELNTKINTGKLQDYLFRSPENSYPAHHGEVEVGFCAGYSFNI
jgi:hypothetical protein